MSSGFQRRGLLDEVVQFKTNHVQNLIGEYMRRLDDICPLHVYMESDVVISEGSKCWLSQMKRIMEEHPQIGILGSLIDPSDFVLSEVAMDLTGGDVKSATFLAKLDSPERRFISSCSVIDLEQDFLLTEPPLPITNPPSRLLMVRTEIIRKLGIHSDGKIASLILELGMQVAITPKSKALSSQFIKYL